MSLAPITTLGSGVTNASVAAQALSAMNYVQGQLVVLFIATENGAAITSFLVTDTAGNTYTVQTKFDAATINGAITIAYCVANSTASVTPTITRGASANTIGSTAWGAIMMLSTAEDTATRQNGNGTSSAPATTAFPKPSFHGGLVLGVTCFIQNAVTLVTYTKPTGKWKNLFNLGTTLSACALGCDYKIADTALIGETYNPALSANRKWATMVISFNPPPNGDMIQVF